MFMRIDPSFQTDARAKPVRPEGRHRKRRLGRSPSRLRDRHELVERGVELLFTRVCEPLAQNGQDLRPRAPVDEDDEAKTELLLVDLVQRRELDEHDGIVAVLLLRALADARMRRERFYLFVLVERMCDLARSRERVVFLREPLDEARPTAEQLGELLDGQLPRYVVRPY